MVQVPSADEAVRRDVVKLLRGPVAQRFKSLMPELAAAADPYAAILGSVQLLDRAFKTFYSRREAFAPFLVDAAGAPVTDDTVRLACGRSVDQVIAMAVRSGMLAYAQRHFGGTAAPAPPDRAAADDGRSAWIAAVARLFRGDAALPARPSPRDRDDAALFYAAIRDWLAFAWQVQFFPIYVAIPPALFAKLGAGIARIDSVEKLQRLAGLAMEDIGKAERVMGAPALVKEMLESNALAAAAVSQMTGAEFAAVHAGLAHLDARRKWDVFANEATAILLGRDPRITQADIVVLSERLHMLNEHAVRIVFDLRLDRKQFMGFLDTAAKALGDFVYTRLFGPTPFFGTDRAAATRRTVYVNFVAATLRDLFTAVKQLMARFRNETSDLVTECLTLVCQSRRDAIATRIAQLAPAAA